MNKLFFQIIIISTLAFIFNSCTKELDDNILGSVELEFENLYDGQKLVLESQNYKNALGQEHTVTMFDYFISNIKLTKENGEVFIIPQKESYFLVKHNDPASKKFTINGVPQGKYKQIKFTVGVDSMRNTMDVSERTGALDVGGQAKGMYWSWNSGYIFLKMEGTSPAAPLNQATGQRGFRFHIGGFGGLNSKTINNIKEITLNAEEASTVRESKTPHAHIFVDASKVMNGKTNVSLVENHTTMFNPFSVNVAENYTAMFKLDHFH